MAWWHCWGCRPPLTASLPHLYWKYGMCLSTFICCGYSYWLTLTLLHLGRLPRLWQFGVSVAKMKWWHDDIVEAIDHHWLLPTSKFDVWKVFEHLHMLWIGMSVHPYTVTPGKIGPDFGNLGWVWLWNDGMKTLLRLYTTDDCFPHPYWMYGKCLSTFICCG